MRLSPSERSSPQEAARRTVLACLEATVRQLAERATELSGGWAVTTPGLDHVWTINQVHLSAPFAPATALELSEAHQHDLPYRHLVMEDEATAEQLARAVATAPQRWHHERLALMVLAPGSRGPAPAARGDGQVVELSEAETEHLMRRWLGESLPGALAYLGQLEEYSRREARLWAEQRLGLRTVDGAPAAMVKLRQRGRVAWLEDVYTVPEQRGRGHARKLMAVAMERVSARDADLAFIVADDNDWPKELYRDMGFRPVGPVWQSHCDLGPGTSINSAPEVIGLTRPAGASC